MKKLLISFAALALLAACNKDDDNNDVKQPEVLAKKITKIEKTEKENGGYERKSAYAYAYNTDGRVATVTDDQDDVTKFTYSEDKVTVGDKVYALENGLVVKLTEDEGEWLAEFSYEDGYLVRTLVTYKEERYKDAYDTEDLIYSEGSLEKYICTYRSKVGDKMEEDTESFVFAYGKQENKMNLDLFAVITAMFEGDSRFLCGIAGNRSVKLPATITYNRMDIAEIEETYTYSYTTDKEGYITEVNVVFEHKDDGKVDEDRAKTVKYVITYEE